MEGEMSAEFIFAVIGVLCSFGIVIMCLALTVFFWERHVPDTFGDGPPDVAAPGSVLCVFCNHKNHPPYLCRAAGAGSCACAGAPPIDDVAAAWARACAEFDEKKVANEPAMKARGRIV
jgi:hypothetical protein